MANIAALIAKLKKERPELADEPLLDAIVDAADPSAPAMDDEMDASMPPADAAPAPESDDEAPAPESEEGDDDMFVVPPEVVSKLKKRRK